VFTLNGEHDISTAPDLERTLAEVAASGTSIVIDLSEAAFIDSQVVGWLVRWSQRAADRPNLHVAISIGTDGAFAKRVIDLLGLTARLPCHPSKTDAVRHLAAETSM
jgi:anti-anti-sigma factor